MPFNSRPPCRAFLRWLLLIFSTFAPSKGIQDSLGFWIPRRGPWILDSLSVEFHFRIPIVSGFADSLSYIPDSWSKISRIPDSTSKKFPDSGFHKQNFPDSRFHKQKFPGIWDPNSLTWGHNFVSPSNFPQFCCCAKKNFFCYLFLNKITFIFLNLSDFRSV